jgi:tryptophan-rich sensory protein
MSPRTEWLGLTGWIALCFAAAAAGGWITSTSVDGWYDSLRKPSWNPPKAVFGPVWTALYIMMGCAAWAVWRRRHAASTRTALRLFAVQLVLNVAWSGLFFGLRRPALAAFESIVLWLAILATALAFRRVSTAAGILLVPYLAWAGFAAALTFTIWSMNA